MQFTNQQHNIILLTQRRSGFDVNINLYRCDQIGSTKRKCKDNLSDEIDNLCRYILNGHYTY